MLSSSVMSSWTKRTRASDVSIACLRAADGVELRAVAKTMPTDDDVAETSCLTSSRPKSREDRVTRYDAMTKAGGQVDVDATETNGEICLDVLEVGKQGRGWGMDRGFRDTTY